jgi:hypothetical protein
MPPGNVEVVQQAYLDVNAFMRGDLPGGALVHLLDPGIEWDWNIGLLRPRQTAQRVRGADEPARKPWRRAAVPGALGGRPHVRGLPGP